MSDGQGNVAGPNLNAMVTLQSVTFDVSYTHMFELGPQRHTKGRRNHGGELSGIQSLRFPRCPGVRPWCAIPAEELANLDSKNPHLIGESEIHG